MSEFWTQYWPGVAVGVTLLIIGFVASRSHRAIRWAFRGAKAVGLIHWLCVNWAYARRGFRWRAALFIDHATMKADAVIYKRSVDVRPDEKQVVRVWDVTSRIGQSRRTFAWQVYKKSVEWCSRNGWSTIEFTGFMPPDALIWPGQTKWTVTLANANNQMCVVIQPGWCPIPP